MEQQLNQSRDFPDAAEPEEEEEEEEEGELEDVPRLRLSVSPKATGQLSGPPISPQVRELLKAHLTPSFFN